MISKTTYAFMNNTGMNDEQIAALPVLTLAEAVRFGKNDPGPMCRCSECNEPMRTGFGLKVHHGYKHSDKPPRERVDSKRNKTTQSVQLIDKPTNKIKVQGECNPNFCPQCGTNMKAVGMAMALSQ